MIGFASLLSLVLAGPHLAAADTTVVRGIVFDSIAAHPIAGASVQLVRADSAHSADRFTAVTDADGRFTVRGMPAGRYVAGFYHPMLDTLGLEVADRVVDITAANSAISLATPSPQTLIRGFCGDSSGGMLPTLLFGHIYDARAEAGIENAPVTVTWGEAGQTDQGLDIVNRTGQAVTRRAGLFALCGVPTDADLAVRVARANDSAAVNVRLPASGILHVTLYMGTAGTTGRIIGHVSDLAQKKAVAAARATAGDRETTANDAGRFVLDNVPTGTQSIDVRAIGYAPVSLLVNVAEGRETNVDVALERVVALHGMVSRDTAASTHLADYLQSKRADPTGAKFIEPTRLEGYPSAQSVCMLLSVRTGASMCRAHCDAFFLNGTKVFYQLTDLEPDDILGVELFRPKAPPARYLGQMFGACPIVVYTRCAGIALRCGKNPASQALNRPKEDDDMKEIRP